MEVKIVLCSVCSVQFEYAVCSLSMYCAVCIVQFAVCSMQFAVCSLQCAVYSVQFSVCSFQCAVCIMMPVGTGNGGRILPVPV